MADQIIDACCLINLYASGKIHDILPAFGGKFYVSEQVGRESMSIRQPDPVDPSLLVVSPIDLSSEFSSGLLLSCRVEGAAEIQSYLEFATQLDDGEASCLAIAKSRGWLVTTDDRKAIRVASESGIAVITTPELIERWVAAARPSPREIMETLHYIERFASFRPRRVSPLYRWWMTSIQSTS